MPESSKMKIFAVLFVIAALRAEVFGMPKHLTIIGNLTNEDLNNSSKIIGKEFVYEILDDEFKVIQFPPTGSSEKVTIEGIAYYDSLDTPSTLDIVHGGLGEDHITLLLRSISPRRVIDSYMYFYGTRN